MARRLDYYIAFFVLLECVLLVAAEPTWDWVIVVIAGYRLLEITQVFANAVLFDRRRSFDRGIHVYLVMSVSRSITHSVVLLWETVLCFALLFFVARGSIDLVSTPFEALDVSMRTMTTVGTSAEAHGVVRFLVNAEPFIGLLFAGTVLARLLNATPPFTDTVEMLEILEDQHQRDISAELQTGQSPQYRAPDDGVSEEQAGGGG